MENAADVLIMAVDMLIFMLALTLCISSFSNVRQGVDNIINRPETKKAYYTQRQRIKKKQTGRSLRILPAWICMFFQRIGRSLGSLFS